MRRALQVPRRPEREGIADVADDACPRGLFVAGHGRDVLPLSRRCLDLETRDVLVPEQREAAKVRVRSGPGVLDLGVVGGRARVVRHVPKVVFGGGIVFVTG